MSPTFEVVHTVSTTEVWHVDLSGNPTIAEIQLALAALQQRLFFPWLSRGPGTVLEVTPDVWAALLAELQAGCLGMLPGFYVPADCDVPYLLGCQVRLVRDFPRNRLVLTATTAATTTSWGA